jgi:hypothetical protein
LVAPGGYEDDAARPRVLRLASGWISPSIHQPWYPLHERYMK